MKSIWFWIVLVYFFSIFFLVMVCLRDRRIFEFERVVAKKPPIAKERNNSDLKICNGRVLQQVSKTLTSVEYEAHSKNFPRVQRECGKYLCPNCHLNRTCFDYSSNIWHPATCPSKLVGPDTLNKCLDGNKTVLLFGDSRIRHLFAEVAALLDMKRFHQKTSGQRMLTVKSALYARIKDKSMTTPYHSAFWDLLPEILVGSYDIAYIWHVLSDPLRELEAPLNYLAGQKGKTYLFMGGNVPWILGLNGEAGFNPGRFQGEIRKGQQRLTELLSLIRSKKSHNMEVIFMTDMLPSYATDNRMTRPIHKRIVESTLNITAENRNLIKAKFPFVKIMDSHKVAHQAFLDLCDGGSLKERDLEDPNGTGHTFYKSNNAWHCNDRWHQGRIFLKGLAQLFLNHICQT